MIPNMYKIAGELLPCVIHVAARTVATTCFIYYLVIIVIFIATRPTGFAILSSSSSVQQVMDLAGVSSFIIN